MDKPVSFRQPEMAEPRWLADTDLGDKRRRSRSSCVDFARNHVGCGYDRLTAR